MATTYYEMPFRFFLDKVMPELIEMLPEGFDIDDPHYIVRCTPPVDGYIQEIEIGYRSDAWRIGNAKQA